MPTLTIMKWNLWFYGSRRNDNTHVARQREQVTFLQSVNPRPDILCLEELQDQDPELTVLPQLVAEFTDALGMRGFQVPARSGLHMAVLWRTDFDLLGGKTMYGPMQHGMGYVDLEVGATMPVRVAVAHLAPDNPPLQFIEANFLARRLGDPRRATILCLDQNCQNDGDPEPDWLTLDAHERVTRAVWHEDPFRPLVEDRRAAALLERGGLPDVAHYLGKRSQPTTFDDCRKDVLRASKLAVPAVEECGVIPTDLSDHYPVWARLDLSRLRPARATGLPVSRWAV
jgi:endonuclease/exonuclease/phosphatase family metal-dependent hydrolase